MKKFLEEYGFAILAAIIVILFIAMSTPIGKLVQSNIKTVITNFATTVKHRADEVDGSNFNAAIVNNILYIQGFSETDQYKVEIVGTVGGAVLSPQQVINDSEPTINPNYSYTKGMSGIDLSSKAINYDNGSEYYAIITDLGTGEKIYSNFAVVNHDTIVVPPVITTAEWEHFGECTACLGIPGDEQQGLPFGRTFSDFSIKGYSTFADSECTELKIKLFLDIDAFNNYANFPENNLTVDTAKEAIVSEIDSLMEYQIKRVAGLRYKGLGEYSFTESGDFMVFECDFSRYGKKKKTEGECYVLFNQLGEAFTTAE